MTGSALTAEGVRRRLTGSVVGAEVHVLARVDSTNARLRDLARAGAAEGTVVIAEEQSHGRGRRGQEWFSPPGVNLHASVLLRPALPPGRLATFSFIASLALTDAVGGLGLRAVIRWPNDVLVGRRKVAGTLVEGAVRADAVDHVILGVGVNINVPAAALRAALGPAAGFATSLAAELGHELDREAFAASYLNALDGWYRAWQAEGLERLRTVWHDRDILTGRRVEVRGREGAWLGRVLGVNEGGALIVRDGGGHSHTLITEEVRVAD